MHYFVLFSAWTIQALIALCWLALLPSDSAGGLSTTRLLLLGITLGLMGISATLAFRARRNGFDLPVWQRDALFLVSISAIALAPLAILTLRALGQTSGFIYTAAAERLTPLACWLTLSGLEAALLLGWQERAELKPAKHIFRFATCFFIVAGILGTLATLLPVRKDGSWGSPATPLLEWQIALALLAALAALLVPKISFNWRGKTRQLETWIPFLIYLLTCIVWLSQPMIPGYFATPPRAPNFEIYPFSDALIYAQYAQSALAGHGFLWPDVPARPLYIAFLTWLHALAGQDYVQVIALQTLALAAFPAILYLIGKELGGHPLGLGLAMLAVLRDLTANVAAPFALNYTYSKLFFSEIPAALLISLFTLFSIRWMRATRSTPHAALFLGGLLGLACLIRLQSAILLVPVIIFAFFVIKDRRTWALGSAAMVLGVALAFAPWLTRNYLATGGLVLDNPISQTMTLTRRWGGSNGNDDIPQLPHESAAQYSSRLGAMAFESLRSDPGRILGGALGHFVNNQNGNLLVFPSRDRLDSPAELLWPQHAFWQNPTPGPLHLVYLFLLGLGLAAAWRSNGLPGLLPFALSLVYNAWTALFLSSGDRFLVPIDWAVYLYLFLGLLSLVSLLLRIPQQTRAQVAAWESARYDGPTAHGASDPVSWRRPLLTAAFILLLGASLPLTEWAFPKATPLNATSAAPEQLALAGRAIYPRYYKANEGEPGSAKLGYGKSDQARLVFFLAGEQSTLVIFPIDRSPKFFPNTANVAVYGTQKEGYLLAEHIQLEMGDKAVQYP